MSNPNRPYVLELAAEIHDQETHGTRESHRAARDVRAAADRNGVSRGQLRDAIAEVTNAGFYGETLQAWVRWQYLEDGRAKGYVGAEDEPTLWVLGQLAHAHYTEDTERGEPVPAPPSAP